jgi:hypothetical protein
MPAHWFSGFLLIQYNVVLVYQNTSKTSCRLSAYVKACKDDHRWSELVLGREGSNLLLDFTKALLVRRGNSVKVLGTIALQDGRTLVGQTAVLLVLLSVPLGALVTQAGPRLTRPLQGRRPPRAVRPRPPHPEQGPTPTVGQE